jgi:hypothetical protein
MWGSMVQIPDKIKIILIYFTIFFIVPIVGTLLHEVGHYLAAIIMGFEARIAYAYTFISGSYTPEEFFIFILWGPLATWIESVIPFLLLYYFYNKTKQKRTNMQPNYFMKSKFLLLLTFSSFCCRFVFNAAGYFISQSHSMDEYRLGEYLGIIPEIIIYGSAIIGLIMMFVLLIRVLPKKSILWILLPSLAGAVLGYYIWYEILGPVILPA